MKKVAALILGLGLPFALATVASSQGNDAAEPLRAALAEIDITPPIGSPMAGYSARQGTASGVLDPLMAQLLVLEQGTTRVAILTFDLRRLVSSRIIEGVKALGIEHVVLASSHTHSGPDADDETFKGTAGPWRRELEDRVVAMVKSTLEDSSRSFEARVAAGEGSVYLGHNRILVQSDGAGGERSTMLWRNAERKPTHPTDPTTLVLSIEDSAGTLRAVLVNHACHAVVLGPDNLQLSADYPGAMRRALATSLGGRGRQGLNPVQVMFLQGAAGDINPYDDKQPIDQRAAETMRDTGEALATAVLPVVRALSSAQSGAKEGNDREIESPATLTARSAHLEFEHRWQQEQGPVAIDLVALQLGNDTAMVFVPGEFFVEHQLRLRARSPFTKTFFVGYATSSDAPWPGYIPTFEAAGRFGYGASYNTSIEEGAGEVIVDRAIIELFRLAGRLETPEGGAVRKY
jgi:hypothetical protein